MLDQLFISTQKPRAWLRQRASVIPAGLWVVMVVVALVFWRYCSVSGMGMHLREITAAYGSTGLFYGVPQSDPAGKRITFCQMSDKGIGVFLLNVATGQKHLVHEKLPLDDVWQNLDVWPWSPDGKLFIYTHKNIFVCAADTGDVVATLPVEGRNGVATLTWLNPTTFAYVSVERNIHLIQQQRGGRWKEMPIGIRVGSTGLTSLSNNTIAWQKGNRIWSLNLASRVASLVFESRTNHLAGFSYSKETGEFLLSCLDNGVDSLWRLTNALSSPIPVQVAVQSPVRNAVWANGSQSGCAYLTPRSPDHNTLTVHPALQPAPVSLFEHGTVETFTASSDGKKLFIVGVISNEPSAGIWQYDVSSGDLRNLVSYADHPSVYARRIEAFHGFSAQWVDYYLYPPADFDRHKNKKYPLVIGDTLFNRTDPEYQNRFHGPLWAPMLANCGAFVVIVERDTWGGGIDQWENRLMNVYQQLAKNPLIDTNRVFLFGTSAETRYLSELAEKQPGLWNGVMLLNPSGMPDFSTLSSGKSAPKILVSAGDAEHEEGRFKQYQQTAGRQGIPVEYYVHAGSGHWLLGRQSFNERCKVMEQFVFDH